jgi:hypothetical protein
LQAPRSTVHSHQPFQAPPSSSHLTIPSSFLIKQPMSTITKWVGDTSLKLKDRVLASLDKGKTQWKRRLEDSILSYLLIKIRQIAFTHRQPKHDKQRSSNDGILDSFLIYPTSFSRIRIDATHRTTPRRIPVICIRLHLQNRQSSSQIYFNSNIWKPYLDSRFVNFLTLRTPC